MKALVAATQAGDRTAVDAIFGPQAKDLLSGDPKQDSLEFAAFSKLIGQFSRLVQKADDRYVLNIGDQNWPFPIPLVRKAGGWLFDTAAGKEEIVNRRIGEDELTAIGVCQAPGRPARICQRGPRRRRRVQVRAKDPQHSRQEGRALLACRAGEEPSPFGPLIAEIRAEGYGRKTDGGQPQPFHGYIFKILTAQGERPPGEPTTTSSTAT